MIVINFLLFAFWLTIFPWGIGLIFNKWYTGERMLPWYQSFLFGLMTELVIFQIIAICLTFLKSTLTLLTILWMICCVLLFILGIWVGIVKRKKLVNNRTGREKKIKSKYKWENGIVVVAVVALVAFQVIFVTLHVHEDLDDAWYVGTAVISYFTDTLNLISPYTGEIMSRFVPDYVLSPWPIFCAMLGILSDMHPAIIMHTFIPIIMIPLCYLVYYLLGKSVFKNDYNKAIWLVLFLCILNIYGNWSIRSTSTFLLFRVWQGKAILSNIIIPFIIYIFVLLVNDLNHRRMHFIMLFVTVIAGTMVSSMGVFLCSVELFILSVVDVLCFKRLKNSMLAFVCVIPCILQFAVYLGMRYL